MPSAINSLRRSPMRSALAWPLTVLIAAVVSGCDSAPGPGTAEPSESPAYVGADTCAGCHGPQIERWQGSHHDLAMQLATRATVLGDFNAAEFRHRGVTSTFRRRGEEFFVETSGADGELAEFPVRYTFGVEPLQQYLVEMPNGKLQALSVAWNSVDGGWFHVYGDEPIDHTDVLHWTQPSQNWDTTCADCHSTGLVKRYDVDADRFDTRWAEIDVACEACHGPGSGHLDWAQSGADGPDNGLTVQLTERAGVSWLLDPGSGNSVRSIPRLTATEIAVCAPCHSRRARIAVPEKPGAEFLDAFLPAVIQPPLYFGDGQIRDEAYVYGSFLQSRMYQQGVTCSDCHEPHSLTLRAPESEVCGQCHASEKYAQTTHHRHQPESDGAACVACHMPARIYMQIDSRRDHSFRVPRLQLSASLGVPEPCTACHADRDADWALRAWHGDSLPPAQPAHWSMLLAGAVLGLSGGDLALRALVEDLEAPAIVRATAVARLPVDRQAEAVESLAQQVLDPSPLVRWGAARALDRADPRTRVRLGLRLLDDPVLAVRLETAIALAPLGLDVIPADQQARFATVLDEYVAAQIVNAERAESHVNIGNLNLYLGRFDEAEDAYRTALKVNPMFVPAYVNLADFYRLRDREGEGEMVLRESIGLLPDQPALRHALGLLLVRIGRMPEALPEFAAAANSPVAEPRFALAYGLALDAQGETGRAIAFLEGARAKFGDDPGLMAGLANLYRRSGETEADRALPGGSADPG